jgi:hypothetical protein
MIAPLWNWLPGYAGGGRLIRVKEAAGGADQSTGWRRTENQ